MHSNAFVGFQPVLWGKMVLRLVKFRDNFKTGARSRHSLPAWNASISCELFA